MATPDGRFVYIANQGTETHPDSTVSVIATDENDVVATIPTGHGAHGVAVSTDGSRAFITNTFANTMTVIDVGTQRALRSIPVGQEPGGVSYRRGPR
jgi:YVTN family beta-propeller protein